MRDAALIFFLALVVVGVVVIGMHVTSILAVGEGHGLRGIGDLYDVLGVDPFAKWALAGVIVGAIGLVALAVVGRAARRREGPAPTTGQEETSCPTNKTARRQAAQQQAAQPQAAQPQAAATEAEEGEGESGGEETG